MGLLGGGLIEKIGLTTEFGKFLGTFTEILGISRNNYGNFWKFETFLEILRLLRTNPKILGFTLKVKDLGPKSPPSPQKSPPNLLIQISSSSPNRDFQGIPPGNSGSGLQPFTLNGGLKNKRSKYVATRQITVNDVSAWRY